jgi:hypothetical protein
MPTPELQGFIEASKSKGASDEFLASMLTRRGWPADEVYAGLGAYWEAATGLAVPQHAASGESAREAFLYLLSFATLSTWATALGSILFQLINRWLPDPVTRGFYYDFRSQVTWQMACLLVAFPIYLLAMRWIVRDTLPSGVGRWLTYIALLITAGTMIGDLICFLDYFLRGEITARFVLKVIVVLAISGAIFAYYLGWLLRKQARGRAFGIPAAIAVAATFCVAMSVTGTPVEQRKLEADRTRVQDLRNLAIAIKMQHDATSRMPATVADLRARHLDPVTSAPYEYRVKDGSSYELCANFSAESGEDQPGVSYTANTFWAHGKGRACFQVDASKMAPW